MTWHGRILFWVIDCHVWVIQKRPMTQPQTRMVTGLQRFLGQIVKKKAEARICWRASCAQRYPYIYIHFLVNSQKKMTI
jgi:hypothetical protein